MVEEAYQRQGYAKQFLTWIETYLQSKDYKSIHAEAHPDSVGFYKRLGYIDMPFNDPEGYKENSQDISMGKWL